MNDTQLAGRTMLKATGIVLIILSALGLLGGLALIGAGLAMGTDDGLGWGLAPVAVRLSELLGKDAVSYTHLTLPTICSV